MDAIDAYFGVNLKRERETFAYNNQSKLGIFIFNIKNFQNKDVVWTKNDFSILSQLTTTYRDIFDQNENYKYLSFSERIALERFAIDKLDNLSANYMSMDPSLIRSELKSIESYLENVYRQNDNLIKFQIKTLLQ